MRDQPAVAVQRGSAPLSFGSGLLSGAVRRRVAVSYRRPRVAALLPRARAAVVFARFPLALARPEPRPRFGGRGVAAPSFGAVFLPPLAGDPPFLCIAETCRPKWRRRAKR